MEHTTSASRRQTAILFLICSVIFAALNLLAELLVNRTCMQQARILSCFTDCI